MKKLWEMKKLLGIYATLIVGFLLFFIFYTPEKTLSLSFSDVLDHGGFVYGISQSEFEEQMAKFSCGGKPLTEAADLWYSDWDDGASLSGGATGFYIGSSYSGNAVTTRLRAGVPLGNLPFPYKIGFDDTVEIALKKVGFTEIAFDLEGNFVSDEGKAGVMTLSQRGNETVTLTKIADSERSNYDKENFSYVLEYRQVLDSSHDTREIETVRAVDLTFSKKTGKLCVYELWVKDNYQ